MIRPARPADAAALRRLQSHLPRPSPRLLDAALAGVDDASAGRRADGPAFVRALVSVRCDDPVGYLLAVPGDGTTYVAELVVAPARRREGRARALLDAVEADRVTVTVDPEDGDALALYRDCGFERVRRLPDFFDEGAAVLLVRE